MRFSAVVAVTAAVLCVSPMLAWAGSPQDTPANDPDRVVCKPGKMPIGSHIRGPSECHTQREWDLLTEDARRTIEIIQAGATHAQPAGN